MATKRINLLVDDLTKKEGPEGISTHTFALNGVTYEIDLTAENSTKLAEALAPFIAVGRRVSGRSRTPARQSRTKEIREWALKAGVDIPQRGRIPAAIVKQFDSAQ